MVSVLIEEVFHCGFVSLPELLACLLLVEGDYWNCWEGPKEHLYHQIFNKEAHPEAYIINVSEVSSGGLITEELEVGSLGLELLDAEFDEVNVFELDEEDVSEVIASPPC